ncbi:MAG: short-chain dehydrogenase [Phycisphaeraceae bacterium]|nr:MAG: short-chain dehydrogenase [Phycisphaeraceae bacterium]
MTTTLITGANRGIGLEFARQLTKAGHTVIATAREPGKAAELKATGARVEQLDATDPASIHALAERLGSTPIDVLINNAAVFLDKKKPSFTETTAEDLIETYRVNVAGPMLVTQALASNVQRSDRKVIAHISSDMGSISRAIESDWKGHLAYRSSKSALNMAHVLMANELAEQGITAVAIHPGWVQTDMGGDGATLTPNESVSAMLKIITGASPADNAKFFSYEGHELGW